MTLTFGVFDHMDKSDRPLTQQYEERLRLIETYDRVGFHAYHLAEHHATPLGMAPSPGVFLAAVAQRTKRLRFGALVHTLSLYHPLRLIEEICMLDQMSGGRFELGIGRGISPHEIAYFGVDPADAQALYVEVSAIVLKALTSRSLTHHGAFFRFDDVPIELEPVQRPHPPLWCGTSSPDSATWLADNRVNVVMNAPPSRVRLIVDRYREEWARSGGNPASLPFLGMARHVVVADSEAEAVKAAAPAYAQWRHAMLLLWDKHGTKPPNVNLPQRFEDFAGAGAALVGTPDKVAAAIEEQADTAGTNYMVCRFAFGDLPFEVSRRSVDLFASEILPRFAAKRVAA
jgi:alkanesulfonate monooxygenase SsuD/methylene tetrahydromethanopterin reductase-like flavin-dependent oxidoreductase (luciferase family)